MKLAFALGLLAWSFTGAVRVVGPEYPPRAFEGGNVVAVLHLTAGHVSKVEVLEGREPFIGASQSALSRWRFEDVNLKNALVVVDFRDPTLYAAGSPAFAVPAVHHPQALPFPKVVIAPPYPTDSLGEGSVILRLVISPSGSVSKTEVLQPLGDLTEAARNTVEKWVFLPARNETGERVESEAFAVCVFRRPLIVPNAPK